MEEKCDPGDYIRRLQEHLSETPPFRMRMAHRLNRLRWWLDQQWRRLRGNPWVGVTVTRDDGQERKIVSQSFTTVRAVRSGDGYVVSDE